MVNRRQASVEISVSADNAGSADHGSADDEGCATGKLYERLLRDRYRGNRTSRVV